jgi:hypothetical protein
MNKPFHLIGICAAACLVIALNAGKSSREPAPVNAQEIQAPVKWVPAAERHAHAADESQRQTRVRELASLQDEQQMRQRAAEKTKAFRENLQFRMRDRWSETLMTNSPAFTALREKAARSPNGEIACTLCDGKGYMHSCVLCLEDSGKCATCKGSGKVPPDEYCPTCLGTGKCYLCFGTGKMSCPFCNDGMIGIRWRMPPNSMPIE